MLGTKLYPSLQVAVAFRRLGSLGFFKLSGIPLRLGSRFRFHIIFIFFLILHFVSLIRHIREKDRLTIFESDVVLVLHLFLDEIIEVRNVRLCREKWKGK